MALPVIGIIGMGYLGNEIARLKDWPSPSWGTNLQAAATEPTSLAQIQFDWRERAHWERLPCEAGTLILTVPPVYSDVETEREHIKAWGNWMNQNRPDCRSLIYISTTGVYPSQDGLWDENSKVEPTGLRGKLRLATEKTLADFFDMRVIRPGAIYGSKRNIGHRIIAGKPIPAGDHPVHRIHVEDLAQIVILALTHKAFPSPLNAVDMDPAPTKHVAEWMLKKGSAMIPRETQLSFKDGYHTRTNLPPAGQRWISNRLLTETCNYQFVYPTYKEGMADGPA